MPKSFSSRRKRLRASKHSGVFSARRNLDRARLDQFGNKRAPLLFRYAFLHFDGHVDQLFVFFEESLSEQTQHQNQRADQAETDGKTGQDERLLVLDDLAQDGVRREKQKPAARVGHQHSQPNLGDISQEK